MIIVNVFFVLFLLARIGTTNKDLKEKLKLEEAISNFITAFIEHLLAIGILISTISTIISIWEL